MSADAVIATAGALQGSERADAAWSTELAPRRVLLVGRARALAAAMAADPASVAGDCRAISLVAVAERPRLLLHFACLAPLGADALEVEREACLRRARTTACSLAFRLGDAVPCDHRAVSGWLATLRVWNTGAYDAVVVVGSPGLRRGLRTLASLRRLVSKCVNTLED
jgi:hypothetical protein